MLDKYLIRHSAPTLAGLKTANLFWYPGESHEVLEDVLAPWRRSFRKRAWDSR